MGYEPATVGVPVITGGFCCTVIPGGRGPATKYKLSPSPSLATKATESCVPRTVDLLPMAASDGGTFAGSPQLTDEPSQLTLCFPL